MAFGQRYGYRMRIWRYDVETGAEVLVNSDDWPDPNFAYGCVHEPTVSAAGDQLLLGCQPDFAGRPQATLRAFTIDASNAVTTRTMTAPTRTIYDRPTISPDGTAAVISIQEGDENVVKVFALDTGKDSTIDRHPGGVYDAKFSPDGGTVTIRMSGTRMRLITLSRSF
jgi:WD40 repeat protein